MCCLDYRHRVINTIIYMSIDKKLAIVAAVWFAIGCLCGFFMGRAVYNQPIEESIVRDTVRITDTIPHYYPQPVDGTVVKYITKYLPVLKTDTVMGTTITHWEYIQTHDTVAVEVPIESKHYHAPEYDAWVSGFEPSLDSIKVYRETQYITETITKMKPPNKLALYLDAGVDYTFNDKRLYPHAGGELVLNNHKRIQFAVEGGIMKTPLASGVNPYAGGKVKIRIL